MFSLWPLTTILRYISARIPHQPTSNLSLPIKVGRIREFGRVPGVRRPAVERWMPFSGAAITQDLPRCKRTVSCGWAPLKIARTSSLIHPVPTC
jgi:hypothetical protein